MKVPEDSTAFFLTARYFVKRFTHASLPTGICRLRSQTKHEFKALPYHFPVCQLCKIFTIWKVLDLIVSASHGMEPICLSNFTCRHFATNSYHKLFPKHTMIDAPYHFFALEGVPAPSYLAVLQFSLQVYLFSEELPYYFPKQLHHFWSLPQCTGVPVSSYPF